MATFEVKLYRENEDSKSEDIVYETVVEATNMEAAVEIAKEQLSIERPAVTPSSNWAWSAFETN